MDEKIEALREKAKAAKAASIIDGWYEPKFLKTPICAPDRDFVAACSPDVILSLLSERDRLREALEQAQVVLSALARPEDDQNRPSGSTILSLWASVIAAEQKCRAALNRSET